ncbi:hypothetical protein DY245_30885 [Streptomyces inhibens]|uniref:Uncharacterized protein n=1 Tax=Streptomyces inhibens TaxID=2293571 RepID=A0A371PW91_STRIH|nr:hypothetical protein DY245_30885 [Streptomyces inhibens]
MPVRVSSRLADARHGRERPGSAAARAPLGICSVRTAACCCRVISGAPQKIPMAPGTAISRWLSRSTWELYLSANVPSWPEQLSRPAQWARLSSTGLRNRPRIRPASVRVDLAVRTTKTHQVLADHARHALPPSSVS